MHKRLSIVLLVAIIVSACGGGPPQITPTVAPTNTGIPTAIVQNVEASPTPIIRVTSTSTPTPRPTNTLIPSETSTATSPPTATATGTQTPTATVTASLTSTLTRTPTPTNTPTLTPSPTNTDVPTPTPLIIGTDTPSPAPSFTPTWTPPPATATDVPSPTPTATFTNTPDLVATANTELLLTRAAASDTPAPATFTPVPDSSPTNTVVPLDATPTVITATPFSGVIPTPEVAFTPLESTPVIDFTAPTATATPFIPITPSPFPIDQIPATVQVQEREGTTILAPTFNNTTTSALTFNVGPGGFFFNGQQLDAGRGVRLFAVNPANPNSFARTDANGFLTFAPIGGGETAILSSPFYDGFSVSSAETNENFVSNLTWSPNGQRLAFIVQPPAGTDNVNAGVWFWDQGSTSTGTLLHDCPQDGANSCFLSSRPVNNWQSIDVDWSPNSNRVVITVFMPQEGRQGIFISEMNFATRRPEAPPFQRWDNAQWLNNVELLVSGRAPDGQSRISTFNTQNGAESVIYNASANGQFMFDAVQRPDGQIIALGREGGAFDGAYRLYRIANGTATPISGFIGNSPPQAVNWSANYGEVVLTINGQQVVVNTNSGAFSNATISGQVQVGAGFSTNASGETVIQAPPPEGVVAGSRYNAGQQIQYVGEIPRNMRIQPNVAAGFADVIQPTDFVTILAGPYDSDGYEWWQVSNRNGTRAWVSVRTLDGFAFFVP